jgi:hypothetical protein
VGGIAKSHPRRDCYSAISGCKSHSLPALCLSRASRIGPGLHHQEQRFAGVSLSIIGIEGYCCVEEGNALLEPSKVPKISIAGDLEQEILSRRICRAPGGQCRPTGLTELDAKRRRDLLSDLGLDDERIASGPVRMSLELTRLA